MWSHMTKYLKFFQMFHVSKLDTHPHTQTIFKAYDTFQQIQSKVILFPK